MRGRTERKWGFSEYILLESFEVESGIILQIQKRKLNQKERGAEGRSIP